MANVDGITVDVGSINAVIHGLKDYDGKLRLALEVIAKVASKKMEEWAKENATWENRTNNARQGLLGEAYWEDKEHLVVAVMHQVDYGIWLELAMAKKYAILEQAIESQKDGLMAQYKKLVG